MYTWELVIKKALKYLQLSVMINYELPTGLSQNLISLLLPMSELPKRLNEPERPTEREKERQRERENHTRHFCSFVLYEFHT